MPSSQLSAVVFAATLALVLATQTRVVLEPGQVLPHALPGWRAQPSDATERTVLIFAL